MNKPSFEMPIMGFRNPVRAAEAIIRSVIEEQPDLALDAESFERTASIVGDVDHEALQAGWVCDDPMRDLQKLACIGGFKLICSKGRFSVEAVEGWKR